jgi:5-methylcytosine-specific restriction endonuclease McrA
MSSGKKFCKKCGEETDRYADGRCAPCIRRKNSEWAKENRDKVNAKSRRWNAANADAKRKTNAAYREVNKLDINARRKAKRDANLAEARALYAAKNASRRHATGKLSKGIVVKLMISQRWRCACCLEPFGKAYHIDHIVPLSRGGTNTDENVQLLLPTCNLQKSTKTFEEFVATRRSKVLRQAMNGGKNAATG